MTHPTLAELISTHGRRVEYSPNRVLFHEGDESRTVYACVSGRINLFVTTPTGREIVLGAKTAGQAFGELSALDGGRRSATAIAMTRTVTAQMTGAEFLAALEETPNLPMVVLRELAEHLRIANSRAGAVASEHVGERVANLLVELTVKFRRHGPKSGPVELPITQHELAAWVSCTREAVARSLAPLRESGAIETGRNRITVHDVDLVLDVARKSAHHA